MANVILCPTLEIAQQQTAQAKALGLVFHTVEAEYGATVVEGTVTLAHHAPAYRHCPAPCNVQVAAIPADHIVVSHLDLDTVGGVLALLGQKPEAPDFWAAVAFIDLNGPHKLALVEDATARAQLQAIWAWGADRGRSPRYTESTDVTTEIAAWADALEAILVRNDAQLMARGQQWAAEVEAAVEACLRPALSTPDVRVFETDAVFCAAAYRDPQTGIFARGTVTLNTKFGSITVAALDQAFDCCALVQQLWGPQAGGHAGIAGSPRGQVMTQADLVAARDAVLAALQG